MTTGRWVLHVDLDAFFASVEQLTRPTLRGRPVLVGGAGPRGVVAGASYEARVFGARSAMPMSRARHLVGASAVVVPPRGAVYRVLSGAVFETLRDAFGVLETLSLDEAFGEPAALAGRTVAEVVAYCEDLRAAVRERTGLVASIGAGSGKQIAKIGSGLAKPDGVFAVDPADELTLLHGLPVRKLWGIGPVSDERLRKLGIETIGDLAALPESEAASILGATVGPGLHRLARGIDHRAVAERADAKQVSAETTYPTDIVTATALRSAIGEAAASAVRRLAADGRAARTVVLKLRRADMTILTRSSTLAFPTSELATIRAVAQRAALDPLEIGPVRLVGVGLSGLTHLRQDSLFPELDGADPSAGADASAAFGASAQVAVGEIGTPGEGVTPGEGGGERVGSFWVTPATVWSRGLDVAHPAHGHGWVQGSGHGRVSVRFETRSTGPGPVVTFADDDPDLTRADPLDSLR